MQQILVRSNKAMKLCPLTHPQQSCLVWRGGGVVRIAEETHSLTPPWPRNNFHTVLTDFDAVSIWPQVRKCKARNKLIFLLTNTHILLPTKADIQTQVFNKNPATTFLLQHEKTMMITMMGLTSTRFTEIN